MVKTDKLFDFVKSMTSHERGYFKHSSNKDSFYVILFDAICKQNVYDEAALAEELKKRGCKRKITAMKDYLWHELTQAMAPYHLIKTPLGEAMAKMQALHLMYNKGLTKHIIKELDSIKKFCIKFELYDTWLHALQFEFSFGFQQHTLNDAFWQQFHEAVKANMIYVQLSEIQHRLYVYSLNSTQLVPGSRQYSEVKLLMSHPVLHDSQLDKMTRMVIARESILELYARLINDYSGIIAHNMRIASLLESKPELIKDGREISLIYTNIVVALANAGQRKKLADSIDEIITKLRSIPHNHIYALARQLEVQVLRLLTLNEFKDIDKLIHTFRENFSKIPVSVKHHLYYNFTISLYKSGRTDEALDWIDEAMTFYRKHKLLSDANLNMLRLLHILIHYEKGNTVYVKNQLESFSRTYKPAVKDKDTVFITLHFMKQALKSANPLSSFEKMKQKLQAVDKNHHHTIFFSVRLWAESRLSKIEYGALSKQIADVELNEE